MCCIDVRKLRSECRKGVVSDWDEFHSIMQLHDMVAVAMAFPYLLWNGNSPAVVKRRFAHTEPMMGNNRNVRRGLHNTHLAVL